MNLIRRMTRLLTAAVIALGAAVHTAPDAAEELTASAADTSYAVQEFRFGIGDTNRSICASAAEEGAYLNSVKSAGADNEKWYLNYISDGVYEIVNAETGLLITNQGGLAVLSTDVDGANQRWNIVGTDTDHEGYYLYYKVVSNADASAALTFQQNSNSISVESYSGDLYQKFKLNLDGLEGFAANCMVSEGEKAGTIGGLLGETVFVSTDTEMIEAMASEEPLTIVMTQTIDFHPYGQLRLQDNKTITGYYGVTLKDCQLRTNNQAGDDASNKPSDNIVIRNLNLLAKDSLNCILVNVYSSRNIWIDHCTFVSELGRTKDEVGKFIWINTPYDGVDLSRSPDYVTISYCSFNNRYWTVAYGTQNGETTRCRTTLMYNWWSECVRRTPQIGNGWGHIYNDYHSFTSGEASSQIIGGDGSTIVSENCSFDGLSGLEIEGGGGSSSPYRDNGSIANGSSLGFSASYSTNWNPAEHYGYSLLAANTTASFCKAYAGAYGSADKIKFITDADMSGYIAQQYPNPFLKDIEIGNDPVGGGAVMNTNMTYSFKNVNSGLWLEVADAEAASGANVQQGSTGAIEWTLQDAGDGYYYIYSTLGDGNTYVLDLAYGDPANNTNIGIWTNTEDDSKMFRFIDNGDGSYTIATKSSSNKSCIGIVSGSAEEGANAVQWTRDGSDNQKWIAEINGTLIQHLIVEDTATRMKWSIDENAAVGDLLYGDRDNAFYETIPEALLGAEMIVTACDAKNSAENLAVFTAGADMTAYVALDARVVTAPDWLNSWTKTEFTITSSRDVTYALYQLDCKKGDTVTLGTNGQVSDCVNYTVFAVAASVNVIRGNVNGDETFSFVDVVMLQKYLLNAGSLTDWRAGDLHEDGIINGYDLAYMKRMLFETVNNG